MKAVSARVIRYEPDDGTRLVETMIVADTTPEPLPTTGENVDGLMPSDRFAPFSLLYVVAQTDSKVFVADESGHFIPQ